MLFNFICSRPFITYLFRASYGLRDIIRKTQVVLILVLSFIPFDHTVQFLPLHLLKIFYYLFIFHITSTYIVIF